MVGAFALRDFNRKPLSAMVVLPSTAAAKARSRASPWTSRKAESRRMAIHVSETSPTIRTVRTKVVVAKAAR